MTAKTISGSLAHGVTLNTATYNYSPLYVSGTISAAAGDGVHGDTGRSWTIDNTGTIKAAAGVGVKLLEVLYFVKRMAVAVSTVLEILRNATGPHFAHAASPDLIRVCIGWRGTDHADPSNRDDHCQQ
jgi:hypothetical protein